jgi:shikimate dehydrogenase
MWTAVFERLGLPWHYGLLDVDEGGLGAALEGLLDRDVLGYNVTMPYKRWACEQAAIRSRDVQRAGVCNWLHAWDGQLAADNTDVEGARTLLDAIPASDGVLLLGAGGTAAAMLTALEGRAERVAVANRTHERAVELAERASAWLDDVRAVPWEDRLGEASRAGLIINTTPLGRGLGSPNARSPLEDARPRDDARIYDLVYGATPTALARQAGRWGVPLADGLAHLEAQAVALLSYLGLSPEHADLVRSSLSAAAGRPPHRWRVPDPAA